MFFIHFFSVSGILLFGYCLTGTRHRRGSIQNSRLVLLFAAALSIRLLAAALSRGFGTDTACFRSEERRVGKEC